MVVQNSLLNPLDYLKKIKNNHLFSNDYHKNLADFLYDSFLIQSKDIKSNYKLNELAKLKLDFLQKNHQVNYLYKNQNLAISSINFKHLHYFYSSFNLTENSKFKTFYSSGSETKLALLDIFYPSFKLKSQSSFSKDGVFLYKLCALIGFFSCLKKTKKDLKNMHGISLIGRNNIASSSLEWMIDCFSDYFPVSYVNNENELLKKIKLLNSQQKPVWVFATAGHFLSKILIDSDKNIKLINKKDYLVTDDLYKDVFVFETGGTKDLIALIKQSYNFLDLRKTLYKAIHFSLKVSMENIGSEYSSCELASQAWSFKDDRFLDHPYLMPYYFSNPLVKISVNSVSNIDHQSTNFFKNIDHNNNHNKKNFKNKKLAKIAKNIKFISSGELIITDPLRIDMGSSYNCEDYVTLTDDNGFYLHNRQKQACGKGCSWRADFFIDQPNLQINTKKNVLNLDDKYKKFHININNYYEDNSFIKNHLSPANAKNIIKLDDDNFLDELDYEKIYKSLIFLLESNDFYQRLLSEFFDHTIAINAINDLKKSISKAKDKKFIVNSLTRSKVFEIDNDKTVLIIAPKNHTLSCLYPIFFLLLAGKKIIIRLPKVKSESDDCDDINQTNVKKSVIEMFVENIEKSTGNPYKTRYVSNDFKIDHTHKQSTQITQKVDLIFAQGNSNTIFNIKKNLKNRQKISGYGTSIAINVLKKADKDKIKQCFKDFYSLAQRGCMSSVALFCHVKDYELVKNIFCDKKILAIKLCNRDELILLKRKRQLLAYNQSFFLVNHKILCPFYIVSKDQYFNINSIIDPFCFVYPVVFYNDLNHLNNLLSCLFNLKYIASDYHCNDLNIKGCALLPGDFDNFDNFQDYKDRNLYNNAANGCVKKRYISYKNLGELNIDFWNGYFEFKPLFSGFFI